MLLTNSRFDIQNSMILKYISLYQFKKKKKKNSVVNPSKPGLLSFFIFLNASANSLYKTLPSNFSASSSFNLLLFSLKYLLLELHPHYYPHCTVLYKTISDNLKCLLYLYIPLHFFLLVYLLPYL